MPHYFCDHKEIQMSFAQPSMRRTHAKRESIMTAPLMSEPIALAARCVHRIESGKGMEVACVRGAIWVTQECDRRDWVLLAGQSVVLERAGLALVYAFKDALITSGAAWQAPVAAQAQPTQRPERACA
jgi:hypothetical protein